MAETENSKIILVVEDDEFYSKVFKTKLSKEGYSVVIAKNGKEALSEVEKNVPDLILLDLVMPVMDGFETLEKMNESGLTKKTKVIVVSNLGQDSDIDKAKKMGAADYFIKSNISINSLVKIVAKNL